MSKISIAKDLRPMLLARESLKALVGENIFPLYATEGTVGDFILYQRTAGGSEVNQMSLSAEWCEVTFNVVSDVYVKGVEIAEELRSALQDIYVDDQDQLVMTNSHEDFVGENNVVKYVQILVFSIGKSQE